MLHKQTEPTMVDRYLEACADGAYAKRVFWMCASAEDAWHHDRAMGWHFLALFAHDETVELMEAMTSEDVDTLWDINNLLIDWN